jgi:hypothetical protein
MGALVESHKPAKAAPARDVACAREGVRALGVGEEDVLDALPPSLDGLDHRLEVPIGGDEDGGVISVLEGAGQHVDGEVYINTFFFEDAETGDIPLLQVAHTEDDAGTRFHPSVIASLAGYLVGRIRAGWRHVVVEDADELPIASQPTPELGDVDVSRPAALAEPVIDVAPVDKDAGARLALGGRQYECGPDKEQGASRLLVGPWQVSRP